MTIGVNDTFRFAAGDGIRVRDETGLAATDGIARSCDRALCTRSTGRGITRVWLLHTLPSLADEPSLAVRITNTLWSTPCDCVGLGDEARLAPADSIARASHRAASSRATRRGVTRIWFIYASLVLADKASLAVWVPHTLWTTACDCVWLGDEPSLALADSIASIVHRAPSSGTTGVWLAGIRLLHTPARPALEPHPAVWVHNTLSLAPGDGVRVGSEAWLTAAFWVTITVRSACCSWATRCGVARVGGRLSPSY